MTNRLHQEEGWALAIATTLLAIMMTLGLATLGMVDTQGKRSEEQRERDSAFNIAEGVLHAQGFALARNWPMRTSKQPFYPVLCPSTTAPPGQCPDSPMIAGTSTASGANFTNLDASGGVDWKVKVRDNGGTMLQTYDPAVADLPQDNGTLGRCPATGTAPCTTDFNGDNALWVNAKATVDGRTRNLVALMRLEQLAEGVPTAAVTAGALDITMSGNQMVVQSNGAPVGVRCSPSSTSSSGGNGPVCNGAEPGQVSSPPGVTQVTTGNLMTHDQLMRFRDRAIIDGRYYAGCPTPDPTRGNKIWLGGDVVFVEGCDTVPNYGNGSLWTDDCTPDPPSLGGTQKLKDACINQPTRPGVLIWHCGSVNFSGDFTFVGLMYFVNDSNPHYPCSSVDPTPPTRSGQLGNGYCQGTNFDPANDVVFTTGGFGLWGALAIDGPGCMKVKANGFQIFYDANVFGAVRSYGTVGLERSTWRELPPSKF